MRPANLSDLVSNLRPKLADYLSGVLQKDISANPRKGFSCFVHDDKSPSMFLDPKRNFEYAHCFSCGADLDIFDAYARINGYEVTGPDFMSAILPGLTSMYGLPLTFTNVTEADREKERLYRLMSSLAGIVAKHPAKDYLTARKWSDNHLIIGQVSLEECWQEMLSQGYSEEELARSSLLRHGSAQFVGDNLVSFVIKDERGRPVGFVSRSLATSGPKYLNSAESAIYHKKEVLVGLDVALRQGQAKTNGLFLVEGPGDLAALHRIGILNAAAVCGTAFGAQHLALLKSLGIKQVFFCFDWDDAGISAIQKILFNEIKFAPGVSCYVVSAPSGSVKDPSEYCSAFVEGDSAPFLSLDRIPAFEWVLGRISDKATPEQVCETMVPLIASEALAVRREVLASKLSEFTGLSITSIQQDIAAIRDGKEQERRSRLEGAAQKYIKNVLNDPTNISASLASHEIDVENINKDYDRSSTGVSYQVSRFEAIEEQKATVNEDNMTEFVFGFYLDFGAAISGGMNACDGNLMYVGGRANSGKTATVVALGVDVALHDPNASVIFHFTDDSYVQVAPRMLCNIAAMIKGPKEPVLKIHQAANPYRNITDNKLWNVYHRASAELKKALEEERLVIIDSEDGTTLVPLEKQLKSLRSRYPTRKILAVVDNTHNYTSYPDKEKTARMEAIATDQKNLTTKYHCAMLATVEYRKSGILNPSKMNFPDNDDIADARAMIYRPNIIMHIYQDLHDRGSNAEVFWIDSDGVKRPRLLMLFGKNKITSFKSPANKLVFDLDPSNVTVFPKNTEEAREQAARYLEDVEENVELDEEGDTILSWRTPNER